MHEATAVVDLNIARRSDLFAPRPTQGADGDMVTVPADLLQFTTAVRYASGREEGPITFRLPRMLADLGPVERAVMVYASTLYAAGAASEYCAVTFTLHDLARWVGWERPNGSQYDRLEQAVEAVASVRFTQWSDYLEATGDSASGRRSKAHHERVHISSIFGFADEADIETRDRAMSRRQSEHLPANAERRITLWINRRFRQALDHGVSVRLPHEALQRLGLKNHLAIQIYYMVASKRSGARPVELSRSVIEQVARPARSWRRNLRQRTEHACAAIEAADPGWRVSITAAAGGDWKVVATPAPAPNSNAFGVAATGIRGSCNAHSGLLPRKFGVAATGPVGKLNSAKARRARSRHRASRALRA